MKRAFNKLALLLALTVGFTSCTEDKVLLADDVATLYQFLGTTSQFAVTEDMTQTEIVFGVTTRSDVDRQIPLMVDPTSTATPDMYSVPAYVVIPANQFRGTVVVNFNENVIAEGNNYELILKVDEAQYPIINDSGFHILTFFKACPTDLAGMYSVTTTYGFHDFLPDFDTYTMDAEVSVPTGSAPSTYRVLDFSGGLYSVGPYASAYGTGSAGQAGSRDMKFMVKCDNTITWSGEADPYGPMIPQASGVNNYDPATGVITISWQCTAWGENGVSVYTPL